MAVSRLYLAKSGPSSQRSHFAIFIPNPDIPLPTDGLTISDAVGTIINVVGEPLMLGYKLEIKRNYACGANDVRRLVFLGEIGSEHVFQPLAGAYVDDDAPRGRLEQLAAGIPPPPRGQDIRAPIDGVRTSASGLLSISWISLT